MNVQGFTAICVTETQKRGKPHTHVVVRHLRQQLKEHDKEGKIVGSDASMLPLVAFTVAGGQSHGGPHIFHHISEMKVQFGWERTFASLKTSAEVMVAASHAKFSSILKVNANVEIMFVDEVSMGCPVSYMDANIEDVS
eukprot:GHVU01166956.1.p1 GENE.GHVU01166956.1~~GHVU01166956.1.p1  ORF type:complete len:139 (-),score=14.06 GHVU01166956.1:117-533(-)